MSSIELIWNEYHKKLYGFIIKRVKDEFAADDILQEVMIKIHNGLSALKDTEKLQSWIYQIARNSIIDYYRSNRELDQLPDHLLADEDEDETKAQLELSQCLVPMIKELPDEYREAIELSEIKGMKQKDVASVQGISESGARSRVQRGRKQLKKTLDSCCKFEFDARGKMTDYEMKSKESEKYCDRQPE